MKKKTIYVSAEGSDANSGTRNAPLATLTRARDLKRSLHIPAEIVMLAGIYNQITPVCFDENDSHLVIRSEDKKHAILDGGIRFSVSDVKPVTNKTTLNRLDASVRDTVFCLDCSAYKDDFHPLFSDDGTDTVLYIDGIRYEAARYPNKNKSVGTWLGGDYVEMLRMEHLGPDFVHDDFRIYLSDETMSHIAKWDESAKRQMFIYGHFFSEWHDISYRVDSIDFEKNALLIRGGTRLYHECGGGKPFFFCNVLEELDEPGECYIDYQTGKIFFIPLHPLSKDSEIVITMQKQPILSFNHCSDILIQDLDIGYTAGLGIQIDNCTGVTVDGGVFSHYSGHAIDISHSDHITVKNIESYDNGRGSVIMQDCGDRTNLVSCENIVENCLIHDVCRCKKCYVSTVMADRTCGVTVRGCTFYGSPHTLMASGRNNDLLIENNEFYNACLDSDDCGCIYWGRCPDILGTVIRGNYFHDIGNRHATFGVHSIYVDDYATGPEIYQNIFDNGAVFDLSKDGLEDGSTHIFHTYGSFINVHNNVFFCREHQRPMNNLNDYALPNFISMVNDIPIISIRAKGDWRGQLIQAGFFSELWRHHYSGTQWERLWQFTGDYYYTNLQSFFRDGKENDEHAAHLARYWIYEQLWDHIGQNGEYVNESLSDYIKQTYAIVFRTFRTTQPNEWENREPLLHLLEDLLYDDKIHIDPTNTFENNVTVGEEVAYLNRDRSCRGHGCRGMEKNVNLLNDRLPNGKSVFNAIRKGSAVTEDGLAYVRKYIPQFMAFDTKQIGYRKKNRR